MAFPLANLPAHPRRAVTPADELGLLIDGATNYAIYMLDPEGRITIWNLGAERIKGWTQAEIVGRHVSIFYPPDEVAAGKPQSDLDRARACGRTEEDGWRLRRDGSEFLASVTITALHDAGGTLRGFGKVVRDITDQKASEAALARREEHLRSILATVPDAMIVIAETGAILSFSAAAERLFGYAEADMIGADVGSLIPRAERASYEGPLRAYLASGDVRAIGGLHLVNALRRDGTTFPVELAIGETLSGGQRIFTGFIRDLSQRRRTELRMQALQSELIHVSRLSAMGTMASTLAHELNQPLTAIANWLEAARDMLDAPDMATLPVLRAALDEAAGQSIRAGQIVRRLRDFTASGELEQRPERLAPLVREAAALGVIGAREAGVSVTMAFHDEADTVIADRVQVQQVLVNLIRNAVQAMTDAPVRELTIVTAPEAQGCMQITVADTGAGIAPEMQDRLFQAFVTNKASGMGLGLSICRTIIEAHGGRIWATPRPDGGTAFHFTLRHAAPGDADGG